MTSDLSTILLGVGGVSIFSGVAIYGYYALRDLRAAEKLFEVDDEKGLEKESNYDNQANFGIGLFLGPNEKN